METQKVNWDRGMEGAFHLSLVSFQGVKKEQDLGVVGLF